MNETIYRTHFAQYLRWKVNTGISICINCISRAPRLVLFFLLSMEVAQTSASPSPLWINDIVQEVIGEFGVDSPSQVTTIVGERLKELAVSTDDADKRFYLDYLVGNGDEIERWGAFRSHLSERGYVMLLEVNNGYLVLPHSGYRFQFKQSGAAAAFAFERLFGHPLPADAAPWVIDDQPGNPGGRSGWGWYSDAAVNLKGKLRLTLDDRCKIESTAKMAMIAINEATHTVLFREFGFGKQGSYDWQMLSAAMDNTPVSREGEINEFLSDVTSVNSNRCAFILAYDHLLDRYIHGTEDDHHLSGRFFRSRVARWENKLGAQKHGQFEALLGHIVTAGSERKRRRAIEKVSDYLIDDIVSADFIDYVQSEYLLAGQNVLKLLRQPLAQH